jgi:gluconate 2-dehydrogenase gamma chain
MDRREALRILALAPGVPLAPPGLLSLLREARASVGKQVPLRTLNPHQNATVEAVAEMIIPKTDTPGAADVGASQFVDLIVTEWYNDEERNRFLSGLADLDSRTQTACQKNFVDCAPGQREQALTALGEQMMQEAAAIRDSGYRYRGSTPAPDTNFYYMLRELVLTAYYTSEAGATGELHFQIIPAEHHGCAPVESSEKGGHA